jgi:DNA-binding beta-propeller fold protein YncE
MARHNLRNFVALVCIPAFTACSPSGEFSGSSLLCLTCGPFADNLGGTLSGLVGSRLTLQDNSMTLSQLNGAPANGTNLIFGSADFNTSHDITVATQPTNPSQTCVVANGTGTATGSVGSASNVTNITVTCTTNPPRFVYIANRGSNNLSAYTVDATTGGLAAIAGSPFATGYLPVAIAVDPTGTYAYVANQADATISAFAIDRSSGALNAISGSPFPTGSAPSSVAIDPSSSFVYVTGGNAVTVDPLDSNVYVGNQGDDTVSEFTINSSNGVLTGALTAVSGSPYTTGSGPNSVAVDPLDKFVHVANSSSGTVSAFTITESTGALSAVSGSPYAAGSLPSAIAISD